MPCIHRLQHVQALAAADFAYDDAVRTHAERILHEIADGHRSLAFDVGRAAFEANNVALLQLKLYSILDCHDTVVFRDEG
ncbi:hypothetical protein D9M72_447980 [compost metagenome]